jgi:4,5-DOPA dioxygenase extradiol
MLEDVALPFEPHLRVALDDAPEARRAHPTPEHFWALLVAVGAADAGAGMPPSLVIDGGIMHGMLAMDAYALEGAGDGRAHVAWTD